MKQWALGWPTSHESNTRIRHEESKRPCNNARKEEGKSPLVLLSPQTALPGKERVKPEQVQENGVLPIISNKSNPPTRMDQGDA
jgi:hypothetical protein